MQLQGHLRNCSAPGAPHPPVPPGGPSAAGLAGLPRALREPCLVTVDNLYAAWDVEEQLAAREEASLTAALAQPCDRAPLRVTVSSMVLRRQLRLSCPTWITGAPDQAQLTAAGKGFGLLATRFNLTLENVHVIGFDTGIGPSVGTYPQLCRLPGLPGPPRLPVLPGSP